MSGPTTILFDLGGVVIRTPFELLDTDPARIVLVDDRAANVAGARGSGLAAVWFDPTDVAGSIDRVRAIAS
ncbi:MAG TPA: hypothetical protein VK923_09830 [Euzebyales bacterium]|nr:hypothetical protein [Euzebyales bacterium]